MRSARPPSCWRAPRLAAGAPPPLPGPGAPPRPGRGAGLTPPLGIVMIITAVAMAFQVDVRFQTAIANHLPSALVNPTKSIATPAAAAKHLDKRPPPSRFAQAAHTTPPKPSSADLRDYGPAPDFPGNDAWFNSKP